MSFSFGSNTTSQNTGFGSASKPTFSFGSTNTATTSTAGFGGFGTTTSASGFGTFGAQTSTTATPFGGIGTATTTAPSLFGGTGFGATTAKPATGFGAGFGTTSFGTGTGFGAGTSTFGTPAPTFGTNTLGSNTFGTSSTFGTSFGAKTNTGFGGFGTLGTNTFGQQQQQPQQQQQQQGPTNAHEALIAAVFNCCVFGDERDQVLAKWNLLQAQWGTGQAYYSRNAPPLELNEQNPLCRFKAVGYSKIGGKEDKDGHVALLFNKPEQEIKNNQQALSTSLAGLLGNKPNLAINIDSTKAVLDNKTQVIIYVVDKAANGVHVSATELAAFLNTGPAKNALNTAGCPSITAVTRPTPQMLDQYLQTPPPGMDMRLWKQAQADNPDPEHYIPVPIIGFSEMTALDCQYRSHPEGKVKLASMTLEVINRARQYFKPDQRLALYQAQIKFRSLCQGEEAALQARWLRRARDTLCELSTRRAAAAAARARSAAALHALKHTLLQVIARQEVVGRVGIALSPEEEASRARLQELASQLAAPPLYNGRLNELLCAVRLQRSASAGAPHERYQLDPGAQEDVKQFLSLQQKGMAHLLETAREDLAALNTIAEGMARLVRV